MKDSRLPEADLKRLVKEAVQEVLDERRDLLRDVVTEVLEEYEFVEEEPERRRPTPGRRPAFFRPVEAKA